VGWLRQAGLEKLVISGPLTQSDAGLRVKCRNGEWRQEEEGTGLLKKCPRE